MRKWINLFEGSEFEQSGFFKELDDYLGGDHDSPDSHEYNWSAADFRVSIAHQGPNTVELKYIQIDDEERRSGRGTEIMRELCRLADQYHVRLTLVADESNDAIGDEDGESDYDEREHWLQNWYAKLGFNYTGDTSDYGPWMERLPHA